MTDVLTEYYEKAFEEAGEGGTIYHAQPSVLEMAGHNRKVEILSQIVLPDIENAVVVDYGVGSWGFGCVFPNLKRGKELIGFDVSQVAIDFSRRVSEKDAALCGKQVRYLTSSGYDIPLPSGSVDIFFAGEVIEHIEDSEAFVGEVCRTLKPGGMAIFTTPNEQPLLYKQHDLRWTMGFEHVALMDSRTLISTLDRFLNVVQVKGYTSSLLPDIDLQITDSAYAAEIARIGEDDVAHATGLVVTCRRPESDKRQLRKYRHEIVESSQATAEPAGEDLSLFGPTMGRMAVGIDPQITVPIPRDALRCQLIMWSHPWSGFARIETAIRTFDIDLYNHIGGARRITLNEADLQGAKNLRIVATGQKREQSQGDQAIFFRCVFTLD